MVVVQTGLVDVFVGAVGEHSGPGDGETIVGHLQFPQYSHIFLYLVVAVTSYVPCVVVEHSEWGVGKLVPYAEAFPVSSPASLNLVGGKENFTNSLVHSSFAGFDVEIQFWKG